MFPALRGALTPGVVRTHSTTRKRDRSIPSPLPSDGRGEGQGEVRVISNVRTLAWGEGQCEADVRLRAGSSLSNRMATVQFKPH